MTLSQIDGLQILALAMPAVIVAIALGVFWVTGWLDKREDRRRAQRTVAGE